MEWMRSVACSLFLSATRAQCGRQLAMFVSRLGCSRRCWPSTAHRTAQPLPPPPTPPLPVRSNLTSPTFTPQFSKKSKKWKMIENRINSLANHTITDIEKTGRNKSAIPFGVCMCVCKRASAEMSSLFAPDGRRNAIEICRQTTTTGQQDFRLDTRRCLTKKFVRTDRFSMTRRRRGRMKK